MIEVSGTAVGLVECRETSVVLEMNNNLDSPLTRPQDKRTDTVENGSPCARAEEMSESAPATVAREEEETSMVFFGERREMVVRKEKRLMGSDNLPRN